MPNESPCSRWNQGLSFGMELLDDAGGKAGGVVCTGAAGSGDAYLEVSEDKPIWRFRNGGIGP